MRVTHSHEERMHVPSPEALAGERLKQLRNDRGWSQEEAARRMRAYGCDWHQTTVGRTETAARPLRLNEAVALAALYDVPVTALIAPPPVDVKDIDEEIAAWEKARQQAAESVERISPGMEEFRQYLDKTTELHQELTWIIEHADAQMMLLRRIRQILVSGRQLSPELLARLSGLHELIRLPELVEAARRAEQETAEAPG